MKKNRILFILILITLGLFVSACRGGAGQATSWPGVTVDPNGEVVYVAFGPHIYAVDLNNGKEVWRYPAEANNKISFYAPPALTDDGQLIVGGYDNILYSLNPENGQQNQGNWPFEGSENRYIAGPLTNGELIFAPSTDNNLYVLDMDGNLVWQFKTEEALWGTPVLDGDILYLPAMDHNVYALDAMTGELIWKTEPSLGGSIADNPTLSPDGQLFVGTFGDELLSLDAADGSVNWRMQASNWVWSGPTQGGDTLYFGDLGGFFYSVDASNGSINWKIQPDENERRAITDKPLVIGDTVYFTSESGNLFAVDAATGDPRWREEVGGKLYAGPKGVEDIIVVAPMGIDELLIAFDPEGVQKWVFVPEK